MKYLTLALAAITALSLSACGLKLAKPDQVVANVQELNCVELGQIFSGALTERYAGQGAAVIREMIADSGVPGDAVDYVLAQVMLQPIPTQGTEGRFLADAARTMQRACTTSQALIPILREARIVVAG